MFGVIIIVVVFNLLVDNKMYEIILTTWYQKVGNMIEPLPNSFNDIEEACKYISNNFNEITDSFPVEQITIKYNHNLKIR
jgi:hypothetical protein